MPEGPRPAIGGAAMGPAAALCFSSAGELDVLLPLLHAWGIDDYAVYAFRAELLAKMRDDTFYGGIVGGKLHDRVLRDLSASKLRRWTQFIGNSLRVFPELRRYRSYLFEYGNSGREKNILIGMLVVAGRGRRIFFHPHGHAVTPAVAYDPERWPWITRFAVRFGARIVRLDGTAADRRFVAARYPILRPEWVDFVRRQSGQLYRDHVVILSRDVHPQYLLEENRATMLSDTVAVLKERFPGCRIVLRAHPREFFDSRRLAIGGAEVEVTYENTYAVVRGARFAVSYWTSAFFQCLALGVPVVEYHLPHDRFLANYPGGSMNAEFVPVCRTKEELEARVAEMSKLPGTLAS